jgi:inhibitor of KinA
MIGFMPGFPYLGELPKELQLPRKKTPVISVPAGSVAIAEEYVGIYPLQSPGGWNIIGRTPLQILNYKEDVPCLLDYGMEVEFIPITAVEYERMKDEAARN